MPRRETSAQSLQLPQLFAALARVAERRVGDFKPQALANTAWAFATVGQLDAHLFTALARAAERHMGNFKPHNLANTEAGGARGGRRPGRVEPRGGWNSVASGTNWV